MGETNSVYMKTRTETSLEKEIQGWLSYMSENNFCQDPDIESSITSINSNVEIDSSLIELSELSVNNIIFFINNGIQSKIKLQPVFTTPTARAKYNSLEKKTKEDLRKLIKEEIDDNHIRSREELL